MGNSSQPQGIILNEKSLQIERNLTFAEGGLKSGTGTLSRVFFQSVFFLPKLEVKQPSRKLVGARDTILNQIMCSNPSGDRAGNCCFV